jgi:Icc-related predicted phosphoesterase
MAERRPCEVTRSTIYYASDIHGSELLWRKFLNAGPFYKAEVLIMGGDLTGKAIIPIVDRGGGRREATFMGRPVVMVNEEQVAALEKDIRFNGMYPYRCQPEELAAAADDPARQDELFDQLMVHTFDRWLTIADEKLRKSNVACYVMPGNDDTWVIDTVFKPEHLVRNCDQQVIDIGNGYSMLSLGYSNHTPWDSPRELAEEELAVRIDKLAEQIPDMRKAIFNLHVPPYHSELDTAPLLDADFRPKIQGGNVLTGPVGSTAVRAAIERYQPLLGLHGHIHEAKGAKKIGNTLCINPGSSYNSGRIDGVLIDLEDERVKRFQFVIG